MEPTLLSSASFDGYKHPCPDSLGDQLKLQDLRTRTEFNQGVTRTQNEGEDVIAPLRHDRDQICPAKVSAPTAPLNWPSTSNGLIDRDEEQQQLVCALKRCCDKETNEDATPEMTIITGKSGSGKTALSKVFQHYVQSQTSGFFVSAKFDQFLRSLPYQVFVTAFTDFVSQVTERRENEESDSPFYERLRQRLVKAVGSDSKLLIDMIPALEQLLLPLTVGGDSCGGGGDMGGPEFKARFRTVFCTFVRAICTPDYPVVLFFDDVQWSDTESLTLLRDICTHAGHDGLMVVVACRGNEVSVDDALSRMLRELERDCHVTMNEVLIPELNLNAVRAFVAQTLDEMEEECRGLSELAFKSTGGNTFFLKQYLRSLWDQGILYKDPEGSWQWKKAASQMLLNSDVVALVLQTVQGFEKQVQEVLKVASCLGSEFQEYLLHDVFDDAVDLSGILELLKDRELLEERNSAIRFHHDKIQQACYSLIPELERPAFHLQLGRALWNNCSLHDLSLNVFLVVNQITMGIHLVTDPEERSRLAVLCLHAGERAYQCSAFQLTQQYLELGILLLGRRHWRDEYDSSLALFSAKCEVDYVSGEFCKISDMVEQVFRHARSFQDKLRAYYVHVYVLGALNKPDEAITVGIEVLSELGQPFPAKPRLYHIIRQLMRSKSMLRHVTDEGILSLPNMVDADTLAAMRMLNIVLPYTFLCKPEMCPLFVFKMLQLTLTQGLSVMASHGFSAYGMLCCIAFGSINDGYRYGQLSLNLAHKYGITEMYPRVFVGVYGMITPWKDPWYQSLDPLLQAHQIGLASGENEFSLLAANLYSALAVYSGSRPLDGLAEQMECFHNHMIDSSQEHMLVLLLPVYQHVLTLLGVENKPTRLNGDHYNETQALQDAYDANNKSSLTTIHQYRMTRFYLMADYEGCLVSARKRKACAADVDSAYGKGIYHFFSALASLVAARDCWKRYYKRAARKDLKQLENMSRYGDSMLNNRMSLIRAEFAALDGPKHLEVAMEYYMQSVEYSVKAQNILEEALAFERAALFLLGNAVERAEEATTYLRKALSLYEHYGARIVVERLRKKFGFLGETCEGAK